MSKTEYVINSDSSVSPSIEEFEIDIDRVEWMFDFLVTETDYVTSMIEDVANHGLTVCTLTLTHATRFERTGPSEGVDVGVEKALPFFFSVAGKALEAHWDHLEGLADDAAEMRQEIRYLGM